MKLTNAILIFILVLSINSYAQNYKIVYDSLFNSKIIVGECRRELLDSKEFNYLYQNEYNRYRIKYDSLSIIKNNLLKTKINIVMGSWCDVSRKRVPRLFKILDSIHYNYNNLKIFCVDRKFKGIDGRKFRVRAVPTIFVSDSEIEEILRRIIKH